MVQENSRFWFLEILGFLPLSVKSTSTYSEGDYDNKRKNEVQTQLQIEEQGRDTNQKFSVTLATNMATSPEIVQKEKKGIMQQQPRKKKFHLKRSMIIEIFIF